MYVRPGVEQRRGKRRPAGREYVIDDHDAAAGTERILAERQGRRPVLEVVLLRTDRPGEPAWLADGHEAGAEAVRERR